MSTIPLSLQPDREIARRHQQMLRAQRAASNALHGVAGVIARVMHGEEPTELGLARAVKRRHGHDLMRVVGLGWYVWDGRRWASDIDGAVQRRIIETVDALVIEAGPVVGDAKPNGLQKLARTGQSAKTVSAVAKLLEFEMPSTVKPSDLDARTDLLTCLNGTVCLKTGEFREHRREDLLTHLVRYNYLPEATAPRFMAHVDYFQPDPEMRAFLQRLAGYSLMGNPESKMAVAIGNGANGKRIFFDTLRRVFGETARAMSPKSLEDSGSSKSGSGPAEDILRLRGSRMVLVEEWGQNVPIKTDLIKAFAGGGTMPARGIHEKHSVEVEAKFLLTMTTNFTPIVKGSDDYGVWRRLLFIPFPVQMPDDMKRDRNLVMDELMAEGEGILAWAVAGAIAVAQGKLNPPQACLALTANRREEADTVGGWMAERCETGPECKAQLATLYADYRTWVEQSGLKVNLTKQAFNRELKAKGLEEGRSSAGMMIKGLQLTAVSMEDAFDPSNWQ
jgi:putative DNA primase/helicase